MISFEEKLTNFITGFSYYDLKINQQEAIYQAFFYGTFAFINRHIYEVQSNRESGFGCFDLALIPKNTDALGVILELKAATHINKNPKKYLQQLASAAIQQIDKKDYVATMREHGIRNILKIGIAFHRKQLCIVPAILIMNK